MSLREKINENPQVAAMIAGGVALLAVIWIVWSIVGGGSSGPSFNPEDAKLFYSTDDGATYKPGPASDRLKPGVVRAYVYSVDDGKTPFVGYLERWTPEGVKALEDYEKAIKANNAAEVKRLEPLVAAGREVRKPKVGTWVKSNAPEAAAILAVKGPKGEEDPTEVSATPPAKLD